MLQLKHILSIGQSWSKFTATEESLGGSTVIVNVKDRRKNKKGVPVMTEINISIRIFLFKLLNIDNTFKYSMKC